MAQMRFDPALALSRFGLGAGADGVGAVDDAHAILLAEIAQGPPQPAGLAATPDLLSEVYAYQKAKREARQAANAGDANGPKKPGRDDDPVRPALLAEIDARFNGAVKSPRIGFNERMTQFWANHFAVSTKKSADLAISAGAFEREAIRPHVFGKFSDMLLAVETHPAMLLYLDNQTSTGPDSAAARHAKPGGKRGLNENLAREIMELHTLGVGSGYTQTDVTTFAKILTGWSVARDNDRNAAPGTFVFRAGAHEPGAQTLLGRRYAQTGMDQGKAALTDLARHPATARHIAAKLARAFVADDPPPALVERLRAAFARSDGDLTEVARALIEAPESWSPRLTKLRSPQEYCCALLRATNLNLKPQQIEAALNAMGQPLWQPAGPNGYPDTVAAWNSPEGMATRMEFASMIAQRLPRADPRTFAQSRLGGLLTPAAAQAVARAETQPQGLALLFMSPEFMRR